MKSWIPTNVNVKTKRKKIAIFVIGIFLIGVGLLTKSFPSILVGVLISLSSVLQKNIVIDETGINMNYDALVYKYSEKWDFKEVDTIHKETGSVPNLVMLHFGKQFMEKRYSFKFSEAEEIIDAARLRNPQIYIDVSK